MLARKAKEVLVLLESHGLLKDLILIGSWCCHFYVDYFGRRFYAPSIQTLDIDLLIPTAKRLHRTIDLPKALSDLDFDGEFDIDGWMRFVHPELRVEFLIPRIGAQSEAPKRIPQLAITAMPLRHMHPLIAHTIRAKDKSSGLSVQVPHPFAFALHKLYISHKRHAKDKALSDRSMAIRILDAIEASKIGVPDRNIWDSFTRREQKVILDMLSEIHHSTFVRLCTLS